MLTKRPVGEALSRRRLECCEGEFLSKLGAKVKETFKLIEASEETVEQVLTGNPEPVTNQEEMTEISYMRSLMRQKIRPIPKKNTRIMGTNCLARQFPFFQT
ncbi:hypothetical protein L1987_86936 [Smallanthus sonchifolius]|uniref:Uncharacterized protein n=1 Tax=Smallanthus sonchifolius TaxID=185202 RepID=A0ACB8Y0U7_9ASTR|nr:hypothetical protein L1987_86936 [Smallanthus sonchifolius]